MLWIAKHNFLNRVIGRVAAYIIAASGDSVGNHSAIESKKHSVLVLCISDPIIVVDLEEIELE